MEFRYTCPDWHHKMLPHHYTLYVARRYKRCYTSLHNLHTDSHIGTLPLETYDSKCVVTCAYTSPHMRTHRNSEVEHMHTDNAYITSVSLHRSTQHTWHSVLWQWTESLQVRRVGQWVLDLSNIISPLVDTTAFDIPARLWKIYIATDNRTNNACQWL